MIRILHVVTIMNRGGLENFIMNHYRLTDRTQIQFDFIVHRKERGAFDDEIEGLGGVIYRFGPLRPLGTAKYINELSSFLKQHPEYNIIHSHIDTLSTLPLLAAKLAGVKVRIAHSHSTQYKPDIKAPFRYISKIFIKQASTVQLACSYEAGCWLFGKEFSKDGILKNAIDIKAFQHNKEIAESVRDELKLNDNFILGHVGNFTYAKNHGFILEVFKEVKKRHKSSVLLLIGGGELQGYYREKAAKMGIENSVHILGVRNDVDRIMQAIDVFIFPSIYEGLPLTLIEAQSAGLQCFVSDTVTKACMITPDFHPLSIKEKPEVWAEKIIQAKCGYVRKDYIHLIRDQGFGIEESSDRLKGLYLKLLASINSD